MIERFFIFALALLVGTSANAQDVTVSAAVSLKEALGEIAVAYEREKGHKVQLNFGASGQLLAQIREGAPVDLFIPAADLQMNQAAELKLIDRGTRRVIATNTLVLIVPRDDRKSPLRGFGDLADPGMKRLAIGQPRTVPAGDYAMQVLRHLKLADSLASRLITAASVRQVLDYVERGEVDAGIVYATDAKEAGENVRVIASADPTWHAPIRYPAAIVCETKHRDAAESFITYLSAKPAQSILRGKGFGPPATQPTAPASRTAGQ
jgi:molybdate transport system substrate-binding protein